MTEAKTDPPTGFNLALIGLPEPATPITPATQETPGLAQLLRNRPTLNRKRTLTFLSIRKWPNKNRDAIIAGFKDSKARNDERLARFAASEIAAVLRPWLGSASQFTVTAPPAGVRREGPHFASVMGQAVADLLSIQFEETFMPRTHRGSSFPKKDEKRGKMKMLHPLSTGRINWILVDDISTSASTLEAATHALIGAGAGAGIVIPVCWVYGSADKDLVVDSHAELESVSDSVLSSAAPVLGDEGV